MYLTMLFLQEQAQQAVGAPITSAATPADWASFGEALHLLFSHWFSFTGPVPMGFFSNIDYHQYFVISCFIFCLGFYGVVARRNAISMLLAMELMLNAVNINLSAFNFYWGPKQTLAAFTSEKSVYTQTGQVFSVFTIIVAAAEAAVGLAIIIAFYRARKSIMLDEASLLKG